MLNHAVLVDTFSDEDEPISQLVNGLIQDAISQAASDIHIEPMQEGCRVRFRHDGLLKEITTLSKPLTNRVITRLKILSHLNIAERRLPQDGRLSFKKQVDVRISTCPTLFGEKLVLRILNKTLSHNTIDALGMLAPQKKNFWKNCPCRKA